LREKITAEVIFMEKPKVLFLCTGNTARSQMAEALLKKYAGDRFEVLSAGYEPQEINPLTRKVMAEKGFDLSGHYSKGPGEFLGKVSIRYLIIVCALAEERCPRTFTDVLFRFFWPFEDPAAVTGSEEDQLAAFRRVRDQIDEKIQAWLKENP
jgi:arsenate reductase (thioredoxin)